MAYVTDTDHNNARFVLHSHCAKVSEQEAEALVRMALAFSLSQSCPDEIHKTALVALDRVMAAIIPTDDQVIVLTQDGLVASTVGAMTYREDDNEA
jgi:hypothetical protein